MKLGAGKPPCIRNISFHHIGIACHSLDADERAFSALGYAPEGSDVVDTIQGVRARFLTGPGPRIELVANLAEPGVLSGWLKKGAKIYHLAYEVSDLDESLGTLACFQAKELGEPVPGIAFGMRRLCFCLLANLVLIELIERA